MDTNLKNVIEDLVREKNKNNFIYNLSSIALYKPNETIEGSNDIIDKYNKIGNQTLKNDFKTLISNLLEEYKKNKQHINHNLFYIISLTKLKECINQKFITNENEFTKQLESYESETKKTSTKSGITSWFKRGESEKKKQQTVKTDKITKENRETNEQTVNEGEGDNMFDLENDQLDDVEFGFDFDEGTDTEEEDGNQTDNIKGGKKRKYNKSTMKSGKRIKTSNKIKERLRKVENRKYNVTLKKYKKK